MPFLYQELDNAFFVYKTGVGKTSHIPAGRVLERSTAKPRYCCAISTLSWLGYDDFALGLLAFVDMLQGTLVEAH
jgi:hypothetical protein